MTLKTKIKNKILKREIISSLSPNQLFETVHVKRLYLGRTEKQDRLEKYLSNYFNKSKFYTSTEYKEIH